MDNLFGRLFILSKNIECFSKILRKGRDLVSQLFRPCIIKKVVEKYIFSSLPRGQGSWLQLFEPISCISSKGIYEQLDQKKKRTTWRRSSLQRHNSVWFSTLSPQNSQCDPYDAHEEYHERYVDPQECSVQVSAQSHSSERHEVKSQTCWHRND